MNVHLNLHEAHFPLRMRAIALRHSLENVAVHATDARSSELAPDERASGLASARHIVHHY
jgi:hypothetical protein